MTISGVCEVARKVGPPRNEPRRDERIADLAFGMSDDSVAFGVVENGPEADFFTGLLIAVVVFVDFEESLAGREFLFIIDGEGKSLFHVPDAEPDYLLKVGIGVGVLEDFRRLKIILHK